MSRPPRLVVLGSHVIQYRTPLYSALVRQGGLELQVLYGNDLGWRRRSSPWTPRDFAWESVDQGAYPHRFLMNLKRGGLPGQFFGSVNPALAPRLLLSGADAVLVMGYATLYALTGILTSIATRVPLLYTSDTSSLSETSPGRRLIKEAVLKRLYRHISVFLTTGTRNREHYRAFGVPEDRMVSFPWAVDATTLKAGAGEGKAEARRRLGLDPGRRFAIYVGRLVPEKNVADLLRAVALTPELGLLVVGDGPERGALEALARRLLPGRHHFAGFLNQSTLGQAYTAADVFVLPSSREPWGLVCNEAMYFGLPLVLSDRVGAAADLVVPGVTGFTYPVGEVEALAARLREADAALRANPSVFAEPVRRHIAPYSYEAQVAAIHDALALAGVER